MGQSKGYEKVGTLTSQQQQAQNQSLQQLMPWLQQAQQGYAQFLPGGGGGEAFKAQAQQNFQQNTIPSILNAFGSGSKTNSALNQALAGSAANLNTDLAAQLAQLQLGAAGGLGNLASQAGGYGFQPSFALQEKQMPLWQQGLLAAINAGGKAGAAYLGKPPV